MCDLAETIFVIVRQSVLKVRNKQEIGPDPE